MALKEKSVLKLQNNFSPPNYLYLFGKQLWTITEKEKFLSEEELHLIFLETVDRERRKFERLKNKFSGMVGNKKSKGAT